MATAEKTMDRESILDKIGVKLFGESSEKEKQLEKLIERGGIRLDSEKIPAKSTPNQDISLDNILKHLMNKGSEESEAFLSQISESQLRAVLQPKDSTIPEHYISPPLVFGTEEFGEQDILQALRLRKTFTDVSVEFVLSNINKFHEKRSGKFSEQSLIENLTFFLPSKYLDKVDIIRNSGGNLKDIYTALNFNYGRILSKEDFKNNLIKITSNETNMAIIDVIKEIHDLIQNAGSIDNGLALEETKRFLKSSLNELDYISIINRFDQLKSHDFFTFFRMCKTDFFNTLSKKGKSKVHDIGVLLQELVHETKEQQNTVQGEKRCYKCSQLGHISKFCPMGDGPMYCNMQCIVHPTHKHTNADCFKQKGKKCKYRENHNYHDIGMCKRNRDLNVVYGETSGEYKTQLKSDQSRGTHSGQKVHAVSENRDRKEKKEKILAAIAHILDSEEE